MSMTNYHYRSKSFQKYFFNYEKVSIYVKYLFRFLKVMKIEEEIEEILNTQIYHEFVSAYAYLSLSVALGKIAYAGFAHWMRKQYEEELEHAMKLFVYFQERQGHINLKSFECKNYNIKHPLEAFEIAYELEIGNTKNINAAYALALRKNDYATQTFLHWYIDEQVQEESDCQKFIDALKLAKDCSCSLLTLDQQASQRK